MLKRPDCHIRGCKNFTGVRQVAGNEASEKNVCEAFPQGIPKEIAYGGNPHFHPLPGQKNKIVFEKEV